MVNVDYIELAFTEGATDIGQIPTTQRRRLQYLVKKGVLKEYRDMCWPKPKRHYLHRDLMPGLNIVDKEFLARRVVADKEARHE